MFRGISLAFAVLVFTVATAFAVEEITDPTKDPIEFWHYGTGNNNQTVTFSYDNGCSGYTIKIEVTDNLGEELWSQGYPAASGSPVTQNITVPDPIITSTQFCRLSVIITHTMGNKSTITQEVDIVKP